MTFQLKVKPVISEYKTLRAMLYQMDTNTPTGQHIIAIPEQPAAPHSIHLCLKDKDWKHWKAGLWNQYDKNANMLLLAEPVARETLPEDTTVYPSIIVIQVKEKGPALWKFETRHYIHGGSMTWGGYFDFSCPPTISYPALQIVIATAAYFL